MSHRSEKLLAAEFQRYAADAAKEARLFIDRRDRYKSRVIAQQRHAALYALRSREILFQLIEQGA